MCEGGDIGYMDFKIIQTMYFTAFRKERRSYAEERGRSQRL